MVVGDTFQGFQDILIYSLEFQAIKHIKLWAIAQIHPAFLTGDISSAASLQGHASRCDSIFNWEMIHVFFCVGVKQP